MKKDFIEIFWQKYLEVLIGRELSQKKIIALAIKYRNECLQLWKSFTRRRNNFDTYFENSDSCIAYLLAFHLVNASRTNLIIERLLKRIKNLPFSSDLKVWDLGCGTGAASSALIPYIHTYAPKIHLIDHSEYILDLTKKVFKSLNIQVSTCQNSLKSFVESISLSSSEETTNIIILSYLYNEMSSREAKNLNDSLLKMKDSSSPTLLVFNDSSEDSHCISSMQWREEMVANGFFALYPCPHNKTCPLLDSHNRCYSEGHWERSKTQVKIDEIIGHPRRVFATSGYLLANKSFLERCEYTRPKKVLVGAPRDTQNSQRVRPIYCNKRGSIDKRGSLLFNSFKKRRGEES